MFYSAMPLSFMRAVDAAAAAEKDKLGYDPTTADGKFFRNGSLPSPRTRDVDPEISLGDRFYWTAKILNAQVNAYFEFSLVRCRHNHRMIHAHRITSSIPF